MACGAHTAMRSLSGALRYRPSRGVRLVIILSVVSAVMVIAGGILVVASTATHLIGRRPGSHYTSLGVALGAAGLAVGLVTLLVFAFTRAGRSRRRPAGHRRRAAASPGSARERGRALKPTSVYSPGGLIDVPRDARTPGSAGAARSPGFDGPRDHEAPASGGAREAFRPPTAGGASRGSPSEARPAAGRTGTAPPRPGYQAGAYPAPGPGPGWGHRRARPVARLSRPCHPRGG